MPRDADVPGRWLLSAFGLGFLRPASGTVTSLATAAAVLAVESSLGFGVATAAFLVAAGCAVTLRYGSVRRGDGSWSDPSWIVSDEVAGQSIATGGSLALGFSWWGLATSFVAFRLLDVWKPGPIGAVQRLPGGQGILLDDLFAGLAAAVAAAAVTWFHLRGAA